MGSLFIGSPWQGQSPTRPDPTTYRHADGGDYEQLVFEITNARGQISLSFPIDGSSIPGTPVYLESTQRVNTAKADSITTTNVLGLVNNEGLIQVNGTLTLTTAQWDFITSGSGGLTTGTWYWLSDKVAGKLVTIEPETLGHFSVAILYALSATEALIQINAPDFIVESLFASVRDTLALIDSGTTTHVAGVLLVDGLSIIVSGGGIREADTSGSTTLSIVDTATAIDFPPSFIYFEDLANSLISKSNFDGTGITSIGTDLQDTVIDVGADPINSLIYWISDDSSAQLGQLRAVLGQMRLGEMPYHLRYVPFAGGPSTLSTIPVQGTFGLVLDYNNRWIFQYGVNGLFANQYNADGSQAAGNGNPFTPVGTPGGIAIDKVSTFAGFSPVLYLADNGIPGVVRASVNYADLTTLNGNTTVYIPSGVLGLIACDEINGVLFVMDGTKLMRMSLSGFNPTLVSNVGSTVNALFVDKGQQKVYYEYGNKVVQSNYDGTGAVTVLTSTNTLNANSGYGMAP